MQKECLQLFIHPVRGKNQICLHFPLTESLRELDGMHRLEGTHWILTLRPIIYGTKILLWTQEGVLAELVIFFRYILVQEVESGLKN